MTKSDYSTECDECGLYNIKVICEDCIKKKFLELIKRKRIWSLKELKEEVNEL